MTNFIFKSANRLIKNVPLTEQFLMTKLESIQKELRHQRVDLQEINRKLMKLLIDKHLQMQVDEYFEEGRPQDNYEETPPQTDSEEHGNNNSD